jgi:F-type H+-transporting ATPase subunit gamma
MPSLIDIRRRVRSVKNTQQITKAMKMVSAAKLRKAQERAVAARPYAKVLQQMLANVAEAAAGAGDGETHPLLRVRPEKKVLLVVVTADGGLAGGFNANVIKLAHGFAKQHQNDDLSFELIGRKGRDYFKKRYSHIAGEHIDVFRNVKFENAEKIVQAIVERFTKAEIDAVYLFVNEFKSVMSSHIAQTRLLPIDVNKDVPKSAAPVDYIYEQKPEEILESLLPRYLKVQIYRALLESAAAYLAARMTAMDAATRNADEVIDKLTLYMNRVRQASITREIIEVVSGAAALE